MKKKTGISMAKLDQFYSTYGLSVFRRLPQRDYDFCGNFSMLSFSELRQAAVGSGLFAYIEPDYVLTITSLPNDPFLPLQWALDNTDDHDIDAPEAWEKLPKNRKKVIIGIVDSGIDYTHEDLKSSVWINKNETPDNGIDDDNNGFIDDILGWNFYGNNNNVYDNASHGTHVAGIIGAIGNNSTGIAGINWQVELMPLKFIETSYGYTSDAINAIEYGMANGVRIINASWGSEGYSQSLEETIARARDRGILFVAAAGNYSINLDETRFYPAAYPLSNIISVAATTREDHLAWFSNFGPHSVTIAAPGAGILSTLPANRYGSYDGTSMAAPQVTGVASFIYALNPRIKPEEAIGRITAAADRLPELEGKLMTPARLNAKTQTVANLLPKAVRNYVYYLLADNNF